MIPYHQYDATTAFSHHTYQGQAHDQQAILPRLLFKLPRVVTDQKERYNDDDLFKRHSREGEVRYTLHRDRTINERQNKFQAGFVDGHTEISFSSTGLILLLSWPTVQSNTSSTSYQQNSNNSYCDFTKEHGKVHLRCPFILNGVCVRWKGWLDLERMDGVGCIEFDDEFAKREDKILQQQVAMYSQRIKEYEDRCRRTDLQMKKLQYT